MRRDLIFFLDFSHHSSGSWIIFMGLEKFDIKVFIDRITREFERIESFSFQYGDFE